MNFDKLECGNELDKLIAEKVFGFTEYDFIVVKCPSPEARLLGRFGNYLIEIPQYSSDESAAFEVAYKVGLFDNGNILYRDESKMWVVARLNSESIKFDEYEHSTCWVEPEVIAKDTSIPLVICKAALKMVESRDKFKDAPVIAGPTVKLEKWEKK